ncbi:MAG TPA: hypothetical protein PKI36_04740 [Turneriella sp.]|nr:hypothetical protein [Turneriella sp.]
MYSTVLRFLLIFAFALSAQGLFAQSLKKVMILDFKNLDKNPDYSYLEESITEAIRNELKAKFDFREFPQKDWRNLAEKNFFLWPEENHSRGFALNLGIMARQDIAVGGYYQAIIEKKSRKGVAAGSYVIRAHVYVLDVGKRKVVSEFDMVMPADASLFGAVEELAARVVKEAKSVLPNKGDAGKQQFDDGDVGPHELTIAGGMAVYSLPTAFTGNYTGSSVLYAKDFKDAVAGSVAYTYRDFLFRNAQIELLAGGQFGSNDLSVANDTKRIKASLTVLAAGGHLGYRFGFWRFFLTPFAGGGFSLASVKLDYSTLTKLPLDAFGNELSSSNLNISAPFVEGGLHLGIQMTSRVALQFTGNYRQSIYLTESNGQLMALGGLNFRF